MSYNKGEAKATAPAGTEHSPIKFPSKSVLCAATEIPLLMNRSGIRLNDGPKEGADTVIPGETPSHGEKPVRILNNFMFFSQGRGVFAELDDLARGDYNSSIEGIGEVLAIHGEEMPDEEDDVDEPILLHLTPVINASVDYEKRGECVTLPWC